MPRRKQSLPKKHDGMDDSGEEIQKSQPVKEIDQVSTATITTDMRDSNLSPYAENVANSPDVPQDLSVYSSASLVSQLNTNGLSRLGPNSPLNLKDPENFGALDLSTKKRRRLSFEAKNDGLMDLRHSNKQTWNRHAAKKPLYSTNQQVTHQKMEQVMSPIAPVTRERVPSTSADLLSIANYAALSSLFVQHSRSIMNDERCVAKVLRDVTTPNLPVPNHSAPNFFNSMLKKCRINGKRSPSDGLQLIRNDCSSVDGHGCSPPGMLENAKNGTRLDVCSPLTIGEPTVMFGKDLTTMPCSKKPSVCSPESAGTLSPLTAHLTGSRSSHSSIESFVNGATATPASGAASNFDALSKLSNLVSKVGSSNCSSIPSSSIHHTSHIMSQSANVFATPSIFDCLTASNTDQSITDTVNQTASVSNSVRMSPSEGFLSPAQCLAPSAGVQAFKCPTDGVNFHELWWKFVKKEENAEMKRLNEAKQIFTCLQCQTSFQTMDQLVKHMEATQHYTNIPKHYSWSLQYARQKMRQMKMKMKYSDKMMYFCFLCHSPFTEPVQVHFNLLHNMHNPAENMKYVQIMSSSNGNCTSKNNSTVGSTNGYSNATSATSKASHTIANFGLDQRTGSSVRLSAGYRKLVHSKNAISTNFSSTCIKNQADGPEKAQPTIKLERSSSPVTSKCENKSIVDKSNFGEDPLSLLKNIVK